MIADYGWMLQRDNPCKVHKRKSGKRIFDVKKRRYYKNLKLSTYTSQLLELGYKCNFYGFMN